MSLNIPKLYDLTHPIYHNCPGWPEYKPTNISRDYVSFIHGFNAETVNLNTHTSTHIDVPYHFYDEGDTIDKLPLEFFMGQGVFLDLRSVVKADSPIVDTDLKPFLKQIEPGDFVFLNTGWWAKKGWNKDYIHRWPYLDGSGAKLLIEAKIRAVGIDGLSMGGWGSPAKGRPCHEALLSNKVLIIEEIFYPEEIMDGKKRLVSAFPLKLTGAGGCPVRLVAYDL